MQDIKDQKPIPQWVFAVMLIVICIEAVCMFLLWMMTLGCEC